MNTIEKLYHLTQTTEEVVPVTTKFLEELLKELNDPINRLDQIITAYHTRKGTFNFHLCKFNILAWDFDLYGRIPSDMYDKMEPGDYVVEFVVMDNSFSYDVYYELLKNII